MKPSRERDALGELISLVDDPAKAKRLARNWGLAYLGLFLLIGILVAFELKGETKPIVVFVCFVAGVFAALAYTRLVETWGMSLVANYLDREKVSKKYNDLVEELGTGTRRREGPLKFLVTIAVWAAGTLIFLYLFGKR